MQRIEPQSAVTIRYNLVTHLPDGTDIHRPEEELEFIFKVERQVPTLEEALEGAQAGDTFTLNIPADELYGEHDPELIREIPKAGLIKQRLQEGQFYRQIKQSCLVAFKVLEMREKTVLVDFNKPMAGITVSLDMKVTQVRRATEVEIQAAGDAERKRSIGCG